MLFAIRSALPCLVCLMIFALAGTATAVPVSVTHIDDPANCDTLVVPTQVDELGTGAFPPDELIVAADAFNPIANVTYAAGFLVRLRHTTRSWTRAVAHYHSSERSRGGPYWLKVRLAWNMALKNHYQARRAATIAAYRARRARQIAARRIANRRISVPAPDGHGGGT